MHVEECAMSPEGVGVGRLADSAAQTSAASHRRPPHTSTRRLEVGGGGRVRIPGRGPHVM